MSTYTSLLSSHESIWTILPSKPRSLPASHPIYNVSIGCRPHKERHHACHCKRVEPKFSPAVQINIYLALIVHFAKHCLSPACHQNCFDSGKLGRTAGWSVTSSHMQHCTTAGVTAGPPTKQSNQSICHNSVQFCHSSPVLYPSIYRKLSPLLVIICKGVPALLTWPRCSQAQLRYFNCGLDL